MSLIALTPSELSTQFTKNAWDPITDKPCYPTTVVGINHNGQNKQAVYPNSSRKLNLIARWLGGHKVLGLIRPECNYRLDDKSVPNNAEFIIA